MTSPLNTAIKYAAVNAMNVVNVSKIGSHDNFDFILSYDWLISSSSCKQGICEQFVHYNRVICLAREVNKNVFSLIVCRTAMAASFDISYDFSDITILLNVLLVF